MAAWPWHSTPGHQHSPCGIQRAAQPLMPRERSSKEAALLVFVDATGKELTAEKSQIGERSESESSLKPQVFANLVPPVDFQNLLAFLLSQANRPK